MACIRRPTPTYVLAYIIFVWCKSYNLAIGTGIRESRTCASRAASAQVLWTIPELRQRYVDAADRIFRSAPQDPSQVRHALRQQSWGCTCMGLTRQIRV